MSITRCKSQQQTLSIRVSDSLREFLEVAREFITDGRGETVSISDVGKLLLESARQDRLDFRLEALILVLLGQGTIELFGQIHDDPSQRLSISRQAVGIDD